MVRSQIGSLTFGFSFDHTLCFKFLNGSCELILNIYIPRAFQWYKKLFNLMNFNPYNRPLKIWKSIMTPTFKMGAHLGMCGFILSHFLTFLRAWNVIFGFHFWPAFLQALALNCEPKARVVTYMVNKWKI